MDLKLYHWSVSHYNIKEELLKSCQRLTEKKTTWNVFHHTLFKIRYMFTVPTKGLNFCSFSHIYK